MCYTNFNVILLPKANEINRIALKQIIMFDKEEFQMFIDAAVEKAMTKFLPANSTPPPTEKKYIYSIQGLADFLQCSIVTAQKIKNSGRINYQQVGRKVIFEESEVLKSMSVINGRRANK